MAGLILGGRGKVGITVGIQGGGISNSVMEHMRVYIV